MVRKNSSTDWVGSHVFPSVVIELLDADNYWRKVNHFSVDIWPLIDCYCSSGWSKSVGMMGEVNGLTRL